MRRIPVVREDYGSEMIHIAFNPLLEKFEVADAAIRRDKSYIPDISLLWSKETDLFEIVEHYLSELKDTREISGDEEKKIKKAISRLQSLLSFPFTALELSANISEEDVADVFVCINSKDTENAKVLVFQRIRTLRKIRNIIRHNKEFIFSELRLTLKLFPGVFLFQCVPL